MKFSFFRSRANQLLKNHALIEDSDLAYEVLIAKLRDHCYGQIAESIKQSIGNNKNINKKHFEIFDRFCQYINWKNV
jgi:hypothetical protein